MSSLIVRGVSEIDDLKRLGLPMAQRFKDAKYVWLIGDQSGRQVKGPHDAEGYPVEFIDADPIHGVVAECMMRIKRTYEELHPDTTELAHVFVGLWIFYFIAPPDTVVFDAIAVGDVEKIKASAELFIRSDFGRGPIDTISTDGSSSTPDQSPEGVPSSVGSGEDVRRHR